MKRAATAARPDSPVVGATTLAEDKSTRVLIVDDVLATGGTALAALDLVAQAGGTTVGLSFLIELSALAGRAALTDQRNTTGQWTPTDAQVQSLFIV